MATGTLQVPSGNKSFDINNGTTAITGTNSTPAVIHDAYHTSKTGRVLIIGSAVGYVSAQTWQLLFQVDGNTIARFPYNNTTPMPVTVSMVADITPNVEHRISFVVASQSDTATATIPLYNSRTISVVDI